MPVVRIDPREPDPEVLARAAQVLRGGGLVAFPTETVYGLGAHALDARAVQRIYEAKGRPSYNPVIVHVTGADGAREVVREWTDRAQRLADVFWPGPLTLILRKRQVVPDTVTAGLDAVAVRVPAHPVALGLLRAAAVPVAAPSANRSTEISPTTAAHVQKALGGRVDLILDGGPTSVGIESTVLDLTGPSPVILRPGAIGPRELQPVIGSVTFGGHLAPDDRTMASGGEREAPHASPGLMTRHYAPRARVLLYDYDQRAPIAREVQALAERGVRVGGLLLRDLGVHTPWLMRMAATPEEYARRLYETLHALDDAGCELIVIERVPPNAEWAGVRDRLQRAGG